MSFRSATNRVKYAQTIKNSDKKRSRKASNAKSATHRLHNWNELTSIHLAIWFAHIFLVIYVNTDFVILFLGVICIRRNPWKLVVCHRRPSTDGQRANCLFLICARDATPHKNQIRPYMNAAAVLSQSECVPYFLINSRTQIALHTQRSDELRFTHLYRGTYRELDWHFIHKASIRFRSLSLSLWFTTTNSDLHKLIKFSFETLFALNVESMSLLVACGSPTENSRQNVKYSVCRDI